MNTVRPFLRQALFAPALPALIEGDVVVTYDALRRYCAFVAYGLAKGGVKPGDRVGLINSNSMQLVACSIACAWLGAASASLTSLLSGQAGPKEFEATVKQAGITAAIICGGDKLASANASVSFLPSERVFAVENLFKPMPEGARPPPVLTDAESLLWRIGFTSGTTGTPKAVGWSHRISLLNSGQMQSMYPSGPGERMLLGMGCELLFASYHWMGMLHSGGCVIFAPAQPEAMISAISKQQPSSVLTSSFAASVLAEIAARNMPGGHRVTPPSLKLLAVGGGKMSTEHQRILRERFAPQLVDCYGSSEGGFLARGESDLQIQAPQYVGRLTQWVDAEAVDENDQPLPHGTVGRLRFRNLGMADGYLGDPATTAKHFKNGWFYPGDLGMITTQGLLALGGREDDLINLGGVKVDPVDIETVLNEHPQVVESAVMAANVDGRPGIFAAVLVLKEGHAIESVRPELESLCRAKLPAAHVPKLYVSMDHLPRNETGKLVRRALTLSDGKLS